MASGRRNSVLAGQFEGADLGAELQGGARAVGVVVLKSLRTLRESVVVAMIREMDPTIVVSLVSAGNSLLISDQEGENVLDIPFRQIGIMDISQMFDGPLSFRTGTSATKSHSALPRAS